MSSYVDISRIQETSDGDTDFERELIGMYLEDSAAQAVEIQKLVDQGDYATLKKVAHTLKGASANIGAVGLQQAAFEIEKAAGREASGELSSLKLRLQAIYTDTKAYYEKYMSSLA